AWQPHLIQLAVCLLQGLDSTQRQRRQSQHFRAQSEPLTGKPPTRKMRDRLQWSSMSKVTLHGLEAIALYFYFKFLPRHRLPNLYPTLATHPIIDAVFADAFFNKIIYVFISVGKGPGQMGIHTQGDARQSW